ncbi:MAG TPA: hypothetical protein VMU05_13805 [Dongiaceae bacterium]|nr:hypothetical protein [Dongiaceae bacterium]
MKNRILFLALITCASLNFIACSSSGSTNGASGLPHRVLASQSVTTNGVFGSLVVINGDNDTLPRVSSINGGSTPGFMAISPTRNFVATFDSTTNSVFAVNTSTETTIGSSAGVRLLGPTSSMVLPTADFTGYAAVPSATVNGFSFQGAVQALNFSTGSSSIIAVNGAQTVVSNSDGTQLLAFSADSDVVTVLFPAAAAPPVDTSCLTVAVNTIVSGSACAVITNPSFSRPVSAIINGNTAYILNCGAECGGSSNGQPAPASVSVVDLGTLTVSQSIPVDAATISLLSGSTLYVAGTSQDFTKNNCSGQTTAATVCGRLDVVDLGSGTVTTTAAITDGYHDRIDMTANGQIFVGARHCTDVGDVNNPTGGEVRGCLAIYRTADGSVVIPPDNGDVTGLQGFTTRNVEYVAEGGQLRVYDTRKDTLLINDFLPQGTIDIVGDTTDVKAIDFF